MSEISWNERCFRAVEKDRAETEKKYGIRIGRTEVYCSRCSRPWGSGNHTCQDLRFEALHKKKQEELSELRESENRALMILSDLGPQKVSVLLMIPLMTVSKWIQRGSIPKRYIKKVDKLKKCG